MRRQLPDLFGKLLQGSLRCGAILGGFAVVGGLGACSEDDPPAQTVVDQGVVIDAMPADAGGNCTPSAEVCNGRDDDCDGLVDNSDPDLQRLLFSDPENCGACGNACAAAQATTSCAQGTCFITGCAPGFTDANGLAEDGCESDCIVTAGGREVCDAIDNDCDGNTDEDFDLDTDALNCGACGEICPSVAETVVGCVAGDCAVTACARDRHDLDGDPTNGCEYECSVGATDRVREFCNGRDDDCDGTVDETADLAPPPADLCGAAGVCTGECSADRPCAGADRCVDGVCLPFAGEAIAGPIGMLCTDDADCTAEHPGFACVAAPVTALGLGVTERTCQPRVTTAVCDAEAGWRCARPASFQRGNEAGHCDGLDNDCDGRTDEDFAATLYDDGGRPRTCEAGVGRCRQTAAVRCSDDGLTTYCPAEAMAAPAENDATCDEVDDDCDGMVDEDFEQRWVSLGAFEVFAFEASRPGASAMASGVDISPDPGRVQYREGKACSVAGNLPWSNVTWSEAADACNLAGGRLCTDAEWTRACTTGAGFNFPYGNTFSAVTCNGGGYDIDPVAAGIQSGPVPTGSLAQCVATGAFDLSGNVKEWTDDLRDGLRPVRGGGYESNVAEGLSCGQRGDLKPDTLRSSSLGFRCCRDAAP